MTREEASLAWVIVTASAAYKHYCAEFDEAKRKDFIVAVMKSAKIKNARSRYAWFTDLTQQEQAEILMEYPDIMAQHSLNPIWDALGIERPWLPRA